MSIYPNYILPIYAGVVFRPWSSIVSAIALILAEIGALNYFPKVGRIKGFQDVLIPMHTGTIQFNNIFLSYVCGKTAPKPQSTEKRARTAPNRAKQRQTAPKPRQPAPSPRQTAPNPRQTAPKPRPNHGKTAGRTAGNLTKTADISPKTAGKPRANCGQLDTTYVRTYVYTYK